MLSGLAAAQALESAPAGFVDAREVVPDLALDIRYAGANNFVGRRINGYDAPRCILTRKAAEALALVQRDLAASGFGLKAFDCYRPARAVADFARWAEDVKDIARKRDFYPDIDKRDLFRLGYVARHSGHSRGSTVDVTLIDKASGREIDMGGAFDFMSVRSSFAPMGLETAQYSNRLRLREAMERRGFRAYDKEWWHYTLRDEPFPKTYFDFPVR